VSPDGSVVAYEDRKGYEDTWRKRHTSPVTRDVWTWNRETGAHEKLTSFGGEDRNPVWSSDGATVLYLSEREGTYNVFRRTLDVDERVTSHETHPVRFLSISSENVICYGWNGAVFTRAPDGESQRVTIRVAADDRRNAVERSVERKGATEMAPSPDGEEIAFVVRGEVFVTSVEHGTTKRITTTPEQERTVRWAPDGKSLIYAGERHEDGSDLPSWNLYRSELAREDDERFHRATLLAEERVLANGDETFQPVPSPDGKLVAFLRNRDELAVLDVASGEIRTLVPAERNYSYSDGDIGFSWSPDSRWIAVTYLANRSWIEQIGIVDVAAGTVRDVTMSGYYESNPNWSPDGRALYFTSNRHGRRSHGSWGSDNDVLALYLTQDAYDRATLPEEDYERLREKEQKAKRKGRRGRAAQEDDEDEDEKDEPAPTVEIDFDHMERRLRRITMHSAPISDFVVSKDGEACLYGAEMDGKWDVWMVKPRAGETRRLVRLGDSGGPQLELSKDGKTLFIRRQGGRLAKANVGGVLQSESRNRRRRGGDGEGGGGFGGGGGGGANAEGIGFAAELEIDGDAERLHLFEHMWRQAGAKFYVADLHGADWPMLRANYAQFLPEIENGFDFAELCSELLGELNASHTGCRWRPRVEDGDETAALGLLFETEGGDDGMVIGEVLAGGPCADADSKVRAGHVLTSIDGRALSRDVNPWELLNRKAGKRVRLAFRDDAGATYEQVVRPIAGGTENRLLYRRLIERRRAIVEEASGGRVGYVHVAGMNDRSFREAFRETLGRNADREALIVDTRFNGGGWLHDDLVVFLSGKRYMDFVPRGKERGNMGSEPLHRWHRPSCVLMSEGNYSDAHLFPVAYRAHGIGKLVGAGVAGTGTAVWWERLIDPALVFGIPQVGMVDVDGNYMENNTLLPDVEVPTDPERIGAGVDEQLLAAVRVLLE
jgi:Tol biopolymer transport system component/C-terminal processing protease CtpA/Prc